MRSRDLEARQLPVREDQSCAVHAATQRGGVDEELIDGWSPWQLGQGRSEPDVVLTC